MKHKPMNQPTVPTPTGHHQELAFYEYGSLHGRPIVFLHGANQTGASWADVAALLPDHRAICFDLPGTGSNREHMFKSMAASADAIAHAMGNQFPGARVPIAGISLGAYVGLMLALRHPERVASATLSGFQIAPLPRSFWILVIGALLSPMMTSHSFRKRAARAIGIPETSAAWPARTPPCSAQVLRRINRAAVHFDVREALPALQVPLLALAGDYEAKAIQEALQQVVECTDHAKAALGPGGHAWPAARPDLFARILMNWIEDETLIQDPDLRPV